MLFWTFLPHNLIRCCLSSVWWAALTNTRTSTTNVFYVSLVDFNDNALIAVLIVICYCLLETKLALTSNYPTSLLNSGICFENSEFNKNGNATKLWWSHKNWETIENELKPFFFILPLNNNLPSITYATCSETLISTEREANQFEKNRWNKYHNSCT